MPSFTPQPPLLVNTATAGDQTSPVIAELANGSYAVAWLSSTDQSIHTQLYDASGARLGGESLLADGVGLGSGIDIAALSGGGFVLAFTSGGNVMAQRVDASGQAVGAATVVATAPGPLQPLFASDVDALPGGGFIVTYRETDLPPNPLLHGSVFTQSFDASGAKADAQTVGIFFGQSTQAATVLQDGSWVVTWDDLLAPLLGPAVRAENFSASGAAAGVTTLNPNPEAAEFSPAVATLTDGNYVVVWERDLPSGIQGEVFGPTGQAVTAAIDFAVGTGFDPQVTAMAEGGFLLTWATATQLSPPVAPDPNATWSVQVLGQYFDAGGHAAGDTVQIEAARVVSAPAPHAAPWTVTATPDGGFIVVTQQPGSGEDVFAQKFLPVPDAGVNSFLTGTGGDDHLVGTSALDTAIIDAPLSSVHGVSFIDGSLTFSSAAGTDTLTGIERVRFTDALYALDTHAGGDAWEAAALFRAGFGALPGLHDLSLWTAQADQAPSMSVLAQEMIDFYAPGVSSAALVTDLYIQIVHAVPSADTVQAFVDQIGPGRTFETQGDLFALAASLALNTDQMAGFVGSIQPLDPAFF